MIVSVALIVAVCESLEDHKGEQDGNLYDKLCQQSALAGLTQYVQKYLFKHILHELTRLTPTTMNAHYSMYFITFYFYIISELQFYIIFNILLDNEVMETSKRRSFYR